MIQRIMYAVMLAVGLTFVFGAGNVFTCVELLAGIESIVGENSVFYVNPYSYYYTNPDAILALCFKSILFGILCIVVAVWMKFYFRIKLKFSLCGLTVLVAGIIFCCTDILI